MERTLYIPGDRHHPQNRVVVSLSQQLRADGRGVTEPNQMLFEAIRLPRLVHRLGQKQHQNRKGVPDSFIYRTTCKPNRFSTTISLW